jgi:hypothetical protein
MSTSAKQRRPMRVALGMMLAMASIVLAADTPDLGIQWGENHESLTFTFQGQPVDCYQAITASDWPPAGEPPEVHTTSDWPVMTYHARWATSLADWPAEERDNVLDYVLMRACDVGAFSHVYSDTVRDARVTSPATFVAEAASPDTHQLTELLRGSVLRFEVVAKGGIGASDTRIESVITIGSTADNQTVFYCDKPTSISDNFVERSVVFTAHIVGDELRAEIWGLYVCSPRSTFRDTALSRTRSATEYLVKQMYSYFGSPPDQETIDAYYKTVKEGSLQADLNRGPLEMAASSSEKAMALARQYWPIPAGIILGLACGLWARRKQKGSQLNK